MGDFDEEAFFDRFNTVWQTHDLDGIAEMFTDDAIFETSYGTEPFGKRAVGKAAAVALAKEVFTRMPDVHFEEFRRFATPEFAAVESVMTGTLDGSGPFELHIVDLLTIRDGKVAAKRTYRKVPG
ncbi:MAG: nuclear transport factor 2 family protein [Rickettsiales bacterium]